MHVPGPNNVGRAVQTDPALLRYVSGIKEQKCWELFAQKFDQFRALSNNNLQHATGCANECNMKHSMFNVRSCWPTMLHLFVRGFTVEAVLRDTLVSGQLYSQPPSQNLFFSTPIQTLY